MENSELAKSLDALRERIHKSSKMEQLAGNGGWQFARSEAEKMLDGFRESAVSAKYLNKPVDHASLVGGYNAIKSFLSIIDSYVDAGPAARARLDETVASNQEEIKRLGRL